MNVPAADVHDLFGAVRDHPDFVFGTIFVSGDFPHGTVPDDFSATRATDRLAQAGNQYIGDTVGWPDDEDGENDLEAYEDARALGPRPLITPDVGATDPVARAFGQARGVVTDPAADLAPDPAHPDAPPPESDGVDMLWALLDGVRQHPDYVFGTVFCAEDFPHETVPDDFSAKWATDALITAGAEHISDTVGDRADEDDEAEAW